MATETFEVTTTTVHTFTAGWGVNVTPVWDADSEDKVSEIDVDVVRIDRESVKVIGDVPCINVGANAYVPVSTFVDVPDLTEDDSHDLRSRWFADQEEANAHAQTVQSEWDNPSPWVSFIVL